ncbi:AarF/ABC1/UbiB kinase family protein [Nocardioides sp. GY 10113]|uniref:ABC1 kinase family protein n=1 Tax=Nocardioides sp. GY 10113 TaxID=2569761 RepID=UPI0010A7FC44|nr:AarF/ABC1/UbiB kinase family protein [Nocardioides sp. GY 10113]TIC83266.1 AarF/ABC1/UbiB kinase family protein [Nocardioides sp. GY 10113]
MADLPRKAAARTARLAALPLGYAGRTALGFGKRLGGAPAEAVLTEVQQRTAEQLFRTLGELKGGAMKVGQALSVLEAALPEELAAPYRENLTRLQDSAPPMPTQTVREILTADLGPDWREHLVWLDGGPTAAASIGQVHQGRWRDGSDGSDGGTERLVAVKVQYPEAAEALQADLRTMARAAKIAGPLAPGMDLKPLIDEVQARAAEELDYDLEAEAQRTFAAAFADDPDIAVPDVVAVGRRVLVTEWLDSPASLASVIADGTPEERDHYGALFARFLFSGPARTGLLHADPHPGNFRIIPNPDGSPGRLGVLDYGSVARLPQHGLPEPLGRLISLCAAGDGDALIDALREEGFLKDRMRVDPQLLMDYLDPFVEPTLVERFRFTREWMREQFQRLNDPRNPAYTITMRLNLPPQYLLIHRTWIGGIGVLSQLGAEAPFRALMEEFVPGFTARG